MTTILIVDDHAAFRHQARALLEGEGLTVVGEAADGPSALDAVRSLLPDLVLLDIGLPQRDGFAVARELHALVSAPHIVLISSRDEADYQARLAHSPVAGFIRKDDLSAEALSAIVGDL